MEDMEGYMLAWSIGGGVAAIFCLLIALAAVGMFFRGIWSALKGDVVDGFSYIVGMVIIFAISGGAGWLADYCFDQYSEIKEKKEKEEKESELYDRCANNEEAQACFELCTKYDSNSSCSKLFSYGLQAKKDGNYQQAFEYYDYGCRADNADSCNNLGVLYGRGEGVSKDNHKATELYEKACHLGDTEFGCSNAGVHYFNGDGVFTDKQKAFELFEKGCNAGSEEACNKKKAMLENMFEN